MESEPLVQVNLRDPRNTNDRNNLELSCDFVLVWEEKIDDDETDTGEVKRKRSLINKLKREFGDDSASKAAKRESFEKELEKDAWLQRIDDRRPESTIIHYVLVTIKDQAIVRHVHRRHMRLPLINEDGTERPLRQSLFTSNRSRIPCAADKEADEFDCRPVVNTHYTVPMMELDTADLPVERIVQLLSHRQRQEIANYILMTTPYVDAMASSTSKQNGLGLGCLLSTKVYKAGFCPHEPLKANWTHDNGKCPNLRTYLFKHWANTKKMLVYQPLDQIREYFGETVTFYFAWLGYYTMWLIPAALVGLIVFIVGIFYSMGDEYTDQICKTNLTLCPLCEVRCSAQNLSQQCVNSRISRIFDYPGSVAYSLFMTLWAVIYLEFWKRRTCRIACEWDMLDYVSAEEPIRPEIINYRKLHREKSEQMRRTVKLLKTGMSIVAIFILVAFVLASVAAVILWRLWTKFMFVENLGLVTFGTFFASMSAAMLSCIFMMMFAPLYHLIAKKLTDLELHEHQSSHERSLALKLFCFSFVNFFSSTLYVAFFMGRFMGMPGKLERWFGTIPPESCTGQDCVFDLTKHIFTFLAMKIVVDNFKEHALGPLKKLIGQCIAKLRNKEDNGISAMAKAAAIPMAIAGEKREVVVDPRLDYLKEDYEKPAYDTKLLFDEYLEMVMQFGYVVMFGAACPLIALLALINNLFELRLDAKKLMKNCRRPVAARAQNIGVWEQTLTGMLFISIVTNGCYVAFTTDFLQRLIYKYGDSPTQSMDGYLQYKLVNSSYVELDTLNNGTTIEGPEQTCYFFSDRYNPNIDFYYHLALRLAFVLLFENLAVVLVQILRYMIPNEPSDVRDHLTKENEELDRWHEARGSHTSRIIH